MNALDFVGLLPIIAVATVSVVLMLAISFQRDYDLAWQIAVGGLALSMVAVLIAWIIVPLQVTPLILIDKYALFFTFLLLASGLLVLLFCYDYFKPRAGQNEELFLLVLTALLGGVVLVSSNHFASLFIGLETLSVSLFALIAYPTKESKALEAAIKYLILSAVSSAFLLFGMALVYFETGSLSFSGIGSFQAPVADQSYRFIGMIMFFIGMAFKLSLVPFHMWTSDVYEGAAAPITAFVATVSKGAIFAVLLRYFVQANAFQYENIFTALSLIAMVTIMGGNLLALLQNNIKRMLAYSSIAHLGYLLVAFVAGLFVGVDLVIESVIFYLIAYILTTLGAFGVLSTLSSSDSEADSIEDYTGLFWTNPWIATFFTVMLMSLAGIPLTAGFVAKFYVFAAGVDSSLWGLLLVVIAGSGIGLYYYLRIVIEMAKQPIESSATTLSLGSMNGASLSFLTLLIFWFGIRPSGLIDLITSVSKGFG